MGRREKIEPIRHAGHYRIKCFGKQKELQKKEKNELKGNWGEIILDKKEKTRQEETNLQLQEQTP